MHIYINESGGVVGTILRKASRLAVKLNKYTIEPCRYSDIESILCRAITLIWATLYIIQSFQ